MPELTPQGTENVIRSRSNWATWAPVAALLLSNMSGGQQTPEQIGEQLDQGLALLEQVAIWATAAFAAVMQIWSNLKPSGKRAVFGKGMPRSAAVSLLFLFLLVGCAGGGIGQAYNPAAIDRAQTGFENLSSIITPERCQYFDDAAAALLEGPSTRYFGGADMVAQADQLRRQSRMCMALVERGGLRGPLMARTEAAWARVWIATRTVAGMGPQVPMRTAQPAQLASAVR